MKLFSMYGVFQLKLWNCVFNIGNVCNSEGAIIITLFRRKMTYCRTWEAINNSGSPPQMWGCRICLTYVSKSPSRNLPVNKDLKSCFISITTPSELIRVLANIIMYESSTKIYSILLTWQSSSTTSNNQNSPNGF